VQKKTSIYFLLIGVAIVLAGFTVKHRTPTPAPAKPQEQVIQLPKLPNAELERQQPPVCTVGFAAEKRQVHFLVYLSIQLRSHPLKSTAMFSDAIIACPHKDYLFHIYPSHHFW
jgi:hypothetical protein